MEDFKKISQESNELTCKLTHIITSVAYRYRKSISIIELFVSIYIDIYRVLSN